MILNCWNQHESNKNKNFKKIIKNIYDFLCIIGKLYIIWYVEKLYLNSNNFIILILSMFSKY